MATTKKTAKKAAKKTVKKASKKIAKKASKKKAKKKVAKKVAAPKPVTKAELADLDRKGLAAKARQIKSELLAIRFNLQAPSLRDYRRKKKELAVILGQLR